MKAIWNNTVIAQSSDTVVVEANHYFPADSIERQYFRDSESTSYCPWKGTANYYSVEVGGEINPDAAWYYSSPKEEAAHITDRVAFWHGVEVTG